MKFYGYATRAIEYLFYSLFLLVPLVFTGITSELFEFSKMWLTFGITIAIGFFWFSKMILQRRIIFTRTILDIPILLFLISQIISTVISLDPHVSLWGYYSRWNGGLFSMISYIFLFYAFVSNLAGGGSGRDPDKYLSSESSRSTGGRENERQDPRTRIIRNSLIVSLVSGFLVVLWALPSHFGHDPTCLIFRGVFDVSCWTADFQPKVRIFGPLGQPDWLAGYLGVLLPIAGAFIIQTLKQAKKLSDPRLLFYASCFLLFYLSLLYTGSRSGIASGIVSVFVLLGVYVFLNRKDLKIIKTKFILGLIAIALIISFIVGIQVPIINKFSFNEVQKVLTKPAPLVPRTNTNQTQAKATAPSEEIGGSDSLRIRKIVWRGAISAWLANPVFGTGVETFAFAYYKYRPIEHNRLSEWNFLYNKAHNEYLNYLTTTGAFGLFTYLSFIGLFLAVSGANIFNIKNKLLKSLRAKEVWDYKDPLLISLFASFLSILMINFFGFSVVILNIYLFLIPAFVLVLLNLIVRKKTEETISSNISYTMWSGISILALISLFMIGLLIRYWIADTKYALGYNYNRVQEFQTAYPLLHDAVNLRQEPVFLDEMAVNDAFIATGLILQNSTESAQIVSSLINEALLTSDKLVKEHPHNVVFSKSRTRILYTLSSVNKDYLPKALEAIKKTEALAPTDASVLYNLGVIYGQNNETEKAIETLEKVVAYKPDYKDARYALALFYHDLEDPSYHQKAIDQLKYILEKIDPEDSGAKESLELWEKER